MLPESNFFRSCSFCCNAAVRTSSFFSRTAMRLSRPETEKKSRVSFQDAINAEEQSEKKKRKKNTRVDYTTYLSFFLLRFRGPTWKTHSCLPLTHRTQGLSGKRESVGMHLTLSDRQCSQALARRPSALAAAELAPGVDEESEEDGVEARPRAGFVIPAPEVPPMVFVPAVELTTGTGWEFAVILGGWRRGRGKKKDHKP